MRSNNPVEEPNDGGVSALVRGAGGAILRQLALGERTVTELVTATGMRQPNVSNHLARFRQRGLVLGDRRGKQMVYRLANAGLAHLVVANTERGSATKPVISATAASFVQAILSLREEEPMRIVDGALASGLSWSEIYLEVFVPALRQIGEMWEQDLLPVADEHFITEVITRIMHRLSLALPVAPAPQAPTAVVACVEGELHTVGGRMASDFLIARGWRVWCLGGFLPLEHLADAVSRHMPDAVALCISTEAAAEGLDRTIAWLRDWRGDRRLPLIVAGGRFFTNHALPEGLELGGVDLVAVTGQMDEMVRLRKLDGAAAMGAPETATAGSLPASAPEDAGRGTVPARLASG